jgi:tetratricopeptide (TPR) repeat protein
LAQQRLRQAPGDTEALRLSARAAARQDRDQKALAIYSRLLSADLKPEDYFLLGRALSLAGEAEPAINALKVARAGNPDDADTLELLSRLYYQTNRYYAAEEAAGRLARHPDREAGAQLLLSDARDELDDPAGVAQALQRWLQLNPAGKAAQADSLRPQQYQLARAWLTLGQPARARQLLQTLLESGPAPEASWLLSRAYIQERAWSRAETEWNLGSSYRDQHPLEPEPAPYLGEARCAECHRAQFQAVLASRHATTFARAPDISHLPLPKDAVPDPSDPQVMHEFHCEGESVRTEVRAGGRAFRAMIDYAFGSPDHFTTFVGRDDHNRSVMLRMSAYESPQGLAWDRATGLPARSAHPEEYLGNTLDEGDGVRRCLFCHTTSFRAVLDRVGPVADDHAIGCENCHGPGGHHVAAVAAGFSDPAISRPSKARAADINGICARCHGFTRRDEPAASRTDPAWYRFQSETLTWSLCYTESDGKLSCVTCHDPHRNAETATAKNEAKCLSCHAAGPVSVAIPASRAAHSIPARRPGSSQGEQPPKDVMTPCPVNPAKGCIDCHMPRNWQQDSHSFKTDHFIRVRNRPSLETGSTR